MSADTRPLKTADGGKIAPQYWNPQTNQYEYVEGQDGMAKYVSPNTDLELANVKAELEAIKSRLNEPLDTQLTGSNVAVPVDIQGAFLPPGEALPIKSVAVSEYVEELTVAAGGTGFFELEMTNCENYTVGLMASESHLCVVTAQRKNSSGGIFDAGLADRETILEESDRTTELSEVFQVRAPMYHFFISNRGASEVTYSIYVNKLGYRGV